jgi:hypothetical protein
MYSHYNREASTSRGAARAKYREWQSPEVQKATTVQEYYLALCKLYEHTPGRDGIPETPANLFRQAELEARKARYGAVADRLEDLKDEALRHSLKCFEPALSVTS